MLLSTIMFNTVNKMLTFDVGIVSCSGTFYLLKHICRSFAYKPFVLGYDKYLSSDNCVQAGLV